MITARPSAYCFLILGFTITVFLISAAPRAGAMASQPPKEKTKVAATSASNQSTAKKIKTHPEPSQAEFDARLKGKFAQQGMTDISDNPGFFTVQDKTPGTGVPQDLDKLIRPVLKQLFKDAKLVEDVGEQPPSADGEVEENKLVYVVRLLLTDAEADQLHKELNEKRKWPSSPRIGAKPLHIRGHQKVWMSLFKSTRLRGYSLLIEVNYGTQRITVISYRLGSKYDRLM